MAKSSETSTGFILNEEFRQFMFDKIVPLEDLEDINGSSLANSFPYWRRHGLLPFIQKGKWIKLSFSQLIWIRILDTLRSFGYSIENTQKLCDYLFKDAYDNNLPERNIKDSRDFYAKKKTAGTISEEELSMLDYINDVANDPVLLYVLKFDINYLTNLVTSCMLTGKEAGILVFYNGIIGEHLGTEYFSHLTKQVDPTKPHIYLSISYFLEEFIDQEELQSLILSKILNEDEKRVLKELRNRNVIEIVIKKAGEKDLRIESTQQKSITGEEMKQVQKIFGLGKYDIVTLFTRDERTLNFKRKKINPK